MQGTALGHRLETLNDGLTTFANGERAPMPLAATDIHVKILAGAAQVTTTRRFQNAEQVPIEAIMTFPVGFDAVVTGLSATIDGRRMVGVAQEKSEARETYETALDEGRLCGTRGCNISIFAGQDKFVYTGWHPEIVIYGNSNLVLLPQSGWACGMLVNSSPCFSVLSWDDVVQKFVYRFGVEQ